MMGGGLRTVEIVTSVKWVVKRNVESVVEPCGSHSQRGGRKHPLRSVSGSVRTFGRVQRWTYENHIAEHAEEGKKAHDD